MYRQSDGPASSARNNYLSGWRRRHTERLAMPRQSTNKPVAERPTKMQSRYSAPTKRKLCRQKIALHGHTR